MCHTLKWLTFNIMNVRSMVVLTVMSHGSLNSQLCVSVGATQLCVAGRVTHSSAWPVVLLTVLCGALADCGSRSDVLNGSGWLCPQLTGSTILMWGAGSSAIARPRHVSFYKTLRSQLNTVAHEAPAPIARWSRLLRYTTVLWLPCHGWEWNCTSGFVS